MTRNWRDCLPARRRFDPGAKLVICERSGRWAEAWRHAWPASALLLRETRGNELALEALAQFPASLVAWEITVQNAAASLATVAQASERFHMAAFVLLAEPHAKRHELSFREAGAAAIAWSRRDLRSLSKLAERHFARLSPLTLEFRRELPASLPWSRHDVGALQAALAGNRS